MNKKGFTLIELIVTCAILSGALAVAIPTYSVWEPKWRLKGSATDVYGAMNLAKVGAVRENARAAVIFNLANNTYTAFIDDGPANWALDSGEEILISGTADEGIDMYQSTFPSHTCGFNGRGMLDEDLIAFQAPPYELHLKTSRPQYMGIKVSFTGLVSVITSSDGTTWN